MEFTNYSQDSSYKQAGTASGTLNYHATLTRPAPASQFRFVLDPDYPAFPPPPHHTNSERVERFSGGGGVVKKDGKKDGKKEGGKNSCDQCRKRKRKCDRVLPCGPCTERLETHLCTFSDATPIFLRRDDNDIQELKTQIERLQAVLEDMTKASVFPYGAPKSAPGAASGDFQRWVQPTPNNDAVDIANALSELALSSLSLVELNSREKHSFTATGECADQMIAEAERFCSTLPRRLGTAPIRFDSPNFPLLSHVYFPPPGSFPAASTLLGESLPSSSLVAALPSKEEMDKLIPYFKTYFHWFSHPIHIPTFDRQLQTFKACLTQPEAERDRLLDFGFMATLFTICASALTFYQLPDVPMPREGLVDRWTTAAVLSLVSAKLLSDPTVEAIRAATLLATAHMYWGAGEGTSACIGLLTIAVEGAYTLRLNYDPRRNKKLSFVECEDRRGVFWNLFTQCLSMSLINGQSWPQFDLDQIDTELPLDCHDAELLLGEEQARAISRKRIASHQVADYDTFDETIMTNVIYKTRVMMVVKKICDLSPVLSHAQYIVVRQLHSELQDIENSIPKSYRVFLDSNGEPLPMPSPSPGSIVDHCPHAAATLHLNLASAFVRLHRPWLVLGAVDSRYEFSRRQAVEHAKFVVRRNTTPDKVLPIALHTYRTVAAAAVLAIELLQIPQLRQHDIDKASVLHELVQRAVAATKPFAEVSSVCRKGAKIIEFLLGKWDQQQRLREHPKEQKRSRSSLGAAEEATDVDRLSTALRWSSDDRVSPRSRLQPDSQDGERRRKTTSLHGQPSINVLESGEARGFVKLRNSAVVGSFWHPTPSNLPSAIDQPLQSAPLHQHESSKSSKTAPNVPRPTIAALETEKESR